jgi:very-short-patch-repair endonuclease
MRPPAFLSAQTFAHELRRSATEVERALWGRLRVEKLAGARFRRQVPIGPYIVDFACLKSRLIIELDGSQHFGRASYDQARSAFLETRHFRVLRFWNNDVTERCDAVIETIVWAIAHPDWRQAF